MSFSHLGLDTKKKSRTCLKLLILLLGTLIFLSGCATKAPAASAKKPAVEPSKASRYFLNTPPPTYVLNPATEENARYQLSFPEVSGMQGELTQDYINQAFSSEVSGMVTPDATPQHPLKVTYIVTRKDDHILSVVFTGKALSNGKPVEMKSGVTIDLASSNSINTTNILKSDEASLEAFNKIFSKYARAQNLKTDKIDEFMSMNLNDRNLVFFFYDTETASSYSTVTLPLEEVLPYLNTDFGEPPVS